MAKLVLDLHDIYNRGDQIDRALEQVMQDAIDKKIRLVEIIPGKGSGALKKKVLRYLDRKDVRARYHRIEKDSQLGPPLCPLPLLSGHSAMGSDPAARRKLGARA